VLQKHDQTVEGPSWFARWAGIISILDISAIIAMQLNALTMNVKVSEKVAPTEHLSAVSYMILSLVLLLIIGGLGWCFYRAITATSGEAPIQHPDEADD
jgi:hypothetical protein